MKFYWPLLAVIVGLIISCGDDKKDKVIVDKQVLPNILFIVADDMGFSDSSPFGGEISTPNLQKLSNEGLILTNFYAAPACSPSRSMMLTGVDNHLNGIGAMKEAIDVLSQLSPAVAEKLKNIPGYQGVLNRNVATIPELLNQKGYQSYITGKWHLGSKNGEWPTDRGFDKSYVILQGGSSHTGTPLKGLVSIDTIALVENHIKITPDSNFYSTKNFTDKMLEFIETGDKDKPFFGYLAYTAPHDPLEVPEKYSNKYKGMYDDGYDVLRDKRYQYLIGKGILKEGDVLSKKITKNWDDLSEEDRKTLARSYEIYAGMIDYMDEQIGRVIDLLIKTGQYDNTMIVFLSDNGSEWKFLTEYAPDSKEYVANNFDTSFENIGKANSAASIGPGFAQSCMTPFKGFKEKTSEGGIRMPFIIKWAKMDSEHVGNINTDAIAHINDLAPTIYEMVGIDYPKHFNGNKIESISGASMLPFLKGQKDFIRTDYLGWELHGAKAIRKGDWKILWNDEKGKWDLFNLKKDIGETTDVSMNNPELFDEMKNYWNDYAKTNKVVPIKRPKF